MTNTKRFIDGGAAFPLAVEPSTLDKQMKVSPGMSLRDWIAGQAIGAIIRQCATDLNFRDGAETSEQYFARKAYEVADAMLAARKAGVA